VNGGRANFDGDEGIETTYGSLEWYQIRIVVGEDSEVPWLYSYANTGGDVLLCRFEPSIPLSL
jgi:hypothetical protein